jgi:hypothetical protein
MNNDDTTEKRARELADRYGHILSNAEIADIIARIDASRPAPVMDDATVERVARVIASARTGITAIATTEGDRETARFVARELGVANDTEMRLVDEETIQRCMEHLLPSAADGELRVRTPEQRRAVVLTVLHEVGIVPRDPKQPPAPTPPAASELPEYVRETRSAIIGYAADLVRLGGDVCVRKTHPETDTCVSREQVVDIAMQIKGVATTMVKAALASKPSPSEADVQRVARIVYAECGKLDACGDIDRDDAIVLARAIIAAYGVPPVPKDEAATDHHCGICGGTEMRTFVYAGGARMCLGCRSRRHDLPGKLRVNEPPDPVPEEPPGMAEIEEAIEDYRIALVHGDNDTDNGVDAGEERAKLTATIRAALARTCTEAERHLMEIAMGGGPSGMLEWAKALNAAGEAVKAERELRAERETKR